VKTKHELEDMTKDELADYADDMDIDIHPHGVKDDIIAEILKGQKRAAKEEAKEEAKHPSPPAQSQTQSQPTDAPAENHAVKVDPELAALQEQANKPPDPATQFAAKRPSWEKE
jgi:hypothetical protein